jgi:hypothetical protein
MANLFLDQNELLNLGLSLATVQVLNELTKLSNYTVQNYAGNPENNVTSNESRLCVNTTANQLYFNPDIGAITGWVAV